MSYLKDFSCHTGTLKSDGDKLAVEYKDNGTLKTCFLNATTVFIGAVPDKLAMDTLVKRTAKSPDLALTVNVWVREDNQIANYASPNWR